MLIYHELTNLVNAFTPAARDDFVQEVVQAFEDFYIISATDWMWMDLEVPGSGCGGGKTLCQLGTAE